MTKTKQASSKTFRGLLSSFKADENNNGVKIAEVPSEIELLVEGAWNTPYHGNFEITKEDLAEYKQHADDGVRKGLPIDLEHNTIGGAVGWMEEFEVKPSSADPSKDALWCTSLDWTPKGEELISTREYRFFSPEFQDEDYEDPENVGQFMDNVLIGGGLTNRPLFKNLTPVAASDGTQNPEKALTDSHKQNIIYLNEELLNNMNLQDLLAKKTDELSAEEKAYLLEHRSELTQDQDKELVEAGVLEAKADDGDGSGDDGNGDDGAGSGDDGDGSDDGDGDGSDGDGADGGDGNGGGDGGSTAASEKPVTIKAGELAQLRADAKAGRQASDTLGRKASEEKVGSMLFNEKTGGKLPISAKDEAVDFYHTLSPKQRKAFDGLVEKMPNTDLFKKYANDGKVVAGSAAEELDKQAKEAVKANDGLSYGNAVNQILANDSALKKRYEDEKGNN